MIDLKEMTKEEILATNGGSMPVTRSGGWGVLLYIIDEIYEGLKRPCE